MFNQPNNEIQQLEALTSQFQLTEIGLSNQGLIELDDEQLEEIVGGLNKAKIAIALANTAGVTVALGMYAAAKVKSGIQMAKSGIQMAKASSR